MTDDIETMKPAEPSDDAARSAQTPPASEARPQTAHGRGHGVRGMAKKVGYVFALMFALAVGMWLGGGSESPAEPAPQPGASPEQKREWTCPMHPQIRKDRPDTCPICGMDLVEIESAQGAESDHPSGHEETTNARITLSDRANILARIRTQEIKPMSTATRELRLLGRVDYDETRIKSVTAWTGGRIDRLLVATTGRTIKPGQTIAKLYSPEIYAAHADLVQAARQVERLNGGSELATSAAQAALEAARQRLRLLGVSASQLDTMERADTPGRHIFISSAFGGTVIERLVDEGTYVSAGAALYRVADLSRVWVQLDAYETDSPFLRVDDRVSLTVVGLPGKSFEGRVAFIDPVVNKGTRIVKVRVEVDNKSGELRPGMFAEAVLHSERASAATLMLPRTAPLFTGQRSLVYVEVADGERPTYEAREVILGARTGDWYPVITGLEVGERVVVRGSFVIDADLQIRGGESMMTRDDDLMHEARQPVTDMPVRVRKRMAELLAHYLSIQEALAADDLEHARGAASRLADGVVPASAEIPDKLRPRWDPLATELADYSRYLHGRDDLQRARLAFRRLSERVGALLQIFGNPLDHSLRLFHCEHDFEHSGAYWLQTGEVSGNPYRGQAGEACGLLRAEVAAGAHLQPTDIPASNESSESPDRAKSGNTPAGHTH